MRERAAILKDLEDVGEDLRNLQDPWATAAGELAKLDRQWRLRETREFLKLDKSLTVKAREHQAFEAAALLDDLYERLTACEEGVAKASTIFKALDKRATVAQSELKAQTQELFRVDMPEPAWSHS